MIEELIKQVVVIVTIGITAMVFVWFSAWAFTKSVVTFLKAVFVDNADEGKRCPHCGKTLSEEERS